MNQTVDEIFRVLEKEDYFTALTLCADLIDHFQSRFMEDLTVNTATDYVGAVILYARISSAVKKPWMAFPFLESARGALRFLRDFMTDSDTLAESCFSFAEAYARGMFFPEAVTCFADAARYFTSNDKIKESFSNALFYQSRFGKKIIEDQTFAIDKLGKEVVSSLQREAKADADSLILTDPIESSDAFLRVRYDVEKLTDEILSKKKDEGIPFCILYWKTKKSVLKEKFSLVWKSPADLNPNIRFY